MDKLTRYINELETKVPHFEMLVPSVSQSSVGWHIQHSLLAASQIIKTVAASDPGKYKWQFNPMRILVFTINKIPRGKGKAPKAVVPVDPVIPEQLIDDCGKLKTRIGILTSLKPNQYFEHPYFGNLNVKATIKMLKIHTRHHLAILDDIIKLS
jgi:hypothetical protein